MLCGSLVLLFFHVMYLGEIPAVTHRVPNTGGVVKYTIFDHAALFNKRCGLSAIPPKDLCTSTS